MNPPAWLALRRREIMKITFPNPEGTPSDIVELRPNYFRVRPLLAHSGSQWFYWCAKIDDLAIGEEAVIELEWPQVPKPEELVNPSKEQLIRFTQHGSFVEVLPRIIGVSEDLCSWAFPDSVQEGDVLRVVLEGTGRSFYIATQFPYTSDHLDELFEYLSERAPSAATNIGHSRAGLPMKAIIIDEDAPADAPVVYMQAYQHITEFTGSWVIDKMVRWLFETEAGEELRSRLAFHFVPAVDFDGLTYGMMWNKASVLDPNHLRNININRDWPAAKYYPEVGVVDRFLRSQLTKGRHYCAAFDMHNGWISAEHAGAVYNILSIPWARRSNALSNGNSWITSIMPRITPRPDTTGSMMRKARSPAISIR